MTKGRYPGVAFGRQVARMFLRCSCLIDRSTGARTKNALKELALPIASSKILEPRHAWAPRGHSYDIHLVG
jgi:hypothetical protein